MKVGEGALSCPGWTPLASWPARWSGWASGMASEPADPPDVHGPAAGTRRGKCAGGGGGVDTLRGGGPADLTELSLEAAGLLLGDRRAAEPALSNRIAFETYERSISPRWRPRRFPPGRTDSRPRAAPSAGVVVRCRARAIGELAVSLGAGRAVKDAAVDHAVGVACIASGATRSPPEIRSQPCTRAGRSIMLAWLPALRSASRRQRRGRWCWGA